MHLNQDWISIWKAVSIGVAGVIAIVAVLADTKDSQTKKLTGAGKFTLGATFLSMIAGVGAQIFESQSDAKVARQNSQQTLEMLISMRRSLAPLDPSPKFRLVLEIPCDDPAFNAACREFDARDVRTLPLSKLKAWPRDYQPRFTGWAAIAQGSYLRFGPAPMYVDAAWRIGEDVTATISMDYNVSPALVLEGSLQPHLNKGAIQSVLDFRSRSLTFAASSKLFDFKPLSLQLFIGGGQRVVMTGKDMVQHSYGDRAGPVVARGYAYTFDGQRDPRLQDEYSLPLLSEELAHLR